MSRRALTIIALSAGLAPRALPAAPAARVAVLELEAGEGLDELARTLTGAVRRLAAARPGWTVTDPGTLSVAEAKLTFACLDEDPGCWAQVGRTLDADLLLTGSVQPAAAGLSVALLLFDVRRPRLADRIQRTLPRDGAQAAFSDAARRFLSPEAEDDRTVLRIVVAQDDADVFVDNQHVGASPIPDVPVEPGQHSVLVRLPGHALWRRSVETHAGDSVDLRVVLTRIERPLPGAEPGASATAEAPLPRPQGSRHAARLEVVGWGAVGGGGAIVGVGVIFGLLTSDVLDTYSEPDVPERRAHELKELGERYAASANALYGIGAALVVTGAVLLATNADGTAALELLPMGGDGALGAAARGRF